MASVPSALLDVITAVERNSQLDVLSHPLWVDNILLGIALLVPCIHSILPAAPANNIPP